MRDSFAKMLIVGALIEAALLGVLYLTLPRDGQHDQFSLLNVSYDSTRELFLDLNRTFAEYWKQQSGDTVTIQQLHGASGRQAREVIEGTEADVVSLALAYDIDAIADQGLLSTKWQKLLPHNSAPYTSTVVFVVRAGNPKSIHDWPDLVRTDVTIVMPSPKTSGGARWNYLAAWGFALRANHGDEAAACEFLRRMFARAVTLEASARASTISFVRGNVGDVLITWETEVGTILDEFGADRYEVIVPLVSIVAEPPVAVVDRVVDRHGTRAVAQAYLEFLYSEDGQEIAARHHFRPRSQRVADAHRAEFPELRSFTVDEVCGSWREAQAKHFADGGLFDTIYRELR